MKEQTEKLFYNSIWFKTLSLFIICSIGFIIYSNTFQCSWHLDDENSIVTNRNIRNLSNLRALWGFRPTRFITYLSFALNYHFNQLDVFGYHIVNLAIHLISSVLLWRLVLLTLSAPAMADTKISERAGLIAFFAGLVFTAHPIQTQGVTYIVQRTVSMTTLFYLLSICLYAKSRLLQQKETGSSLWILFYTGSLIFAIVAMFTKEIALTLPFIILLYEFCFLKQKKGANWKLILPFFLFSLFIPLTMFLTKTVNFREMRLMRETPAGIMPGHYLLTQFRVMVTYIRLLFLPFRQNLDYDYPISVTLTDPRVLVSLAFLAVIIFSAFRAYSRYRLISFGVLWFLITLLPESSIVPIQDVIFEHRLYLPMAGFSIFLVCAVYYLFENEGIKPVIVILLMIISVYSVLTYKRNFVWKDEFTLWDDSIRKSPMKARPYNGRGLVYQRTGNMEMAIFDFNKAIQLDPNFFGAYSNRGVIYQNIGDFDKAVSDFNMAIQVAPDFSEAYNNRGLVYLIKGNFDSAISDFNKAIQIDNYFAGAYYNRGLVYQKKGEFQQAVSDYTKAIQLNPNFAEAYNNRGTVYFDQGEYEKCLADICEAKALEYEVRDEFINEILRRAGGN